MSLLYILIGLNSFIFLLPYLVQIGGSGNSFDNLLEMGAKNNADIKDGEYYRLLTSTFLHGDLTHLLFNMYSLWVIGQTTTLVFAEFRFGIIYFVSAIGGSLASFFFNPSPSVGASGAIFGLIGSLLALGIVSRDFGLINGILLNIALNLVFAFLPGSRLDNWGHLGGLTAGFVVGMIILSWKIIFPI